MDSPTSKNALQGWLLTGIVLLFAFHSFAFQRLVDQDLWGHLKFGGQILADRAVPRTDLYSYVPTAPVWFNHEWLCETIYALIFRHLGDGGLLLFKILLGVLASLLILRICRLRGAHPLAAALLIPLALWSLREHVHVRPYVFSYFFFAFFLWILEEKKKWLLAVLPVATAVWANCHAGFVTGLGLMAVYAVTSRGFWRINYSAALCLCGFSVLLNPYGFSYIPFIYSAVTMSRPYITEWRSVPWNMTTFTGYKIVVLLAAASLLQAGWAHARKGRTGIGPYLAPGVLLLLTGYFSWKHYRHLPFFLITAGAFLPALVTELLGIAEGVRMSPADPPDDTRAPRKSPAVPAVLGILLLCGGAAACSELPPAKSWSLLVPVRYSESSSYVFPVEAVSFLVKNGLEGRILCYFDWGEYLIFRRYPGSKVSFDGRLETIYPPEIIKENLDFTFGREGWRKLLVEHPPDLVMVKPELRSFTLMKEEKDWSLLYRDEVCAIFQRAGPVRRFQEPRRQGDLTTLPMRDALGKGEL